MNSILLETATSETSQRHFCRHFCINTMAHDFSIPQPNMVTKAALSTLGHCWTSTARWWINNLLVVMFCLFRCESLHRLHSLRYWYGENLQVINNMLVQVGSLFQTQTGNKVPPPICVQWSSQNSSIVQWNGLVFTTFYLHQILSVFQFTWRTKLAYLLYWHSPRSSRSKIALAQHTRTFTWVQASAE